MGDKVWQWFVAGMVGLGDVIFESTLTPDRLALDGMPDDIQVRNMLVIQVEPKQGTAVIHFRKYMPMALNLVGMNEEGEGCLAARSVFYLFPATKTAADEADKTVGRKVIEAATEADAKRILASRNAGAPRIAR